MHAYLDWVNFMAVMFRKENCALVFVLMIVGCDAYYDYKVDSAIREYKITCFGDTTISCQSMLVDTNILMIETLRDALPSKADRYKATDKNIYDVYLRATNEVLDRAIEYQENLRPSWYYRWFLGGASIEPSGNYLYVTSDADYIEQEIEAQVIKYLEAENLVEDVLNAGSVMVTEKPEKHTTLCQTILNVVGVGPENTIQNIGKPVSVLDQDVDNPHDISEKDKEIYLNYKDGYIKYYNVTSSDKYLLVSVKFTASGFVDVFKEHIKFALNSKEQVIEINGEANEQEGNYLRYYCSPEGNDWIDVTYDAKQLVAGFEYVGYYD